MGIRRLHYSVDLDRVTPEEAKELRSGFLAPKLIEDERYLEPVWPEEANLVSSRLMERPGLHAPVLDIDFPARLVPSSTEGHFHLYLDIEMPWERYEKLLGALYDCGIISKGYYTASIARGATFVRKQGVYKTKRSSDS